jgi:hypothetical protein
MFYYYDPQPQTDDVTRTVAVHECQNCGKACETLTWLEGWNFNACDECAEEAAREDMLDPNVWIDKEKELAELAQERSAA